MISTLAEFVTQPIVFFTFLTLQAVLCSMLVWAILFPAESEEFAKMLFGREKKTYKGKKHDNGYQKILDETDVAEMMRLVKEAWR